MARLKVLVVDSFAGRGAKRPRSQSLGRQAEVMLHTLLADLEALAGVEVTTIAADPAPGRIAGMAEPMTGDPGADVADSASAHATTHVATHAVHDPATRPTAHAHMHGTRDPVDQAPGSAEGQAPRYANVHSARHTGAYRKSHADGPLTKHSTGYPTVQAAEQVPPYMAAEAVGLSLERAAVQPAASRFGVQFDACLQAADAVWPLALESAGALEHLSREILRARRILLGSVPGAVQVAGSKLKLAQVLAEGGVATVATYSPHDAVPWDGGAWVVKPDDGAGCLHTMLFSDRAAALAWIRANGADGYVLQPFVPGRPGSLSLICCDGMARVLSCNQERVAMRDNRFHVLGSIVSGLADDDGMLERLAQQVAAALPGLWGYVGVDFILTAHGAVVLDVNPRLTAAYAGLHASIDHNPAGLVLDLLNGSGMMPSPAPGRRRPVSVDIGAP